MYDRKLRMTFAVKKKPTTLILTRQSIMVIKTNYGP